VLQGLHDGDEVVTAGVLKLKPEAAVAVQGSEPLQGAAGLEVQDT